MRKLARLLGPALLLAGCSSGTGQPEISMPVVGFVEATEADAGGFHITVEEATVAFGPAYFCASASGSATLCEAALGEMRSFGAITLGATDPQPLGTYEGFVGDVRSASFDYGIHWFLTESEPHAAESAPGGHAALLRGRAERGAERVDFDAAIDVKPQFQGQRAVPTFGFEGRATEATSRLEVSFDLGSWLADVDFDAALSAGETSLVIKPGTRDHDAIVIRMVSTSPPTFKFVE